MSESSHRSRKVYWHDDMLADDRHLRHDQDYVESLVGWGLSRSWGSYGIVRTEDGEPGLEVTADKGGSDSSSLYVTVSRCVAITPDGRRILVHGGDAAHDPLRAEHRLATLHGEYDVYVALKDSQGPVRVGTVDGVPLAVSPCELRIQPHVTNERPRPGQVKLAVVLHQPNGEVKVDDDYLPPCVGLRSVRGLESRSQAILRKFHSIMEHSLKIGLLGSGADALAEAKVAKHQIGIFRVLCEKTAIWLGGAYDTLLLSIERDRPPVDLFLFCRQFFRLLDTILGIQGRSGRAELYDVWSNWSSAFKPDDFNQELSSLLNEPYRHEEVATHLRRVFELLDPFEQVLEHVSDLMEAATSRPRPAEPEKEDDPGPIRGSKVITGPVRKRPAQQGRRS